MPGSYRLGPSTRVELMSGPSVGVEGAWFRTPYWGIGGRLSSSYLRVSVNNVSQTENLKCASASAGLYLSYPFSVRWLLGSKLLGGYEGYKSCNTDTTRLGAAADSSSERACRLPTLPRRTSACASCSTTTWRRRWCARRTNVCIG